MGKLRKKIWLRSGRQVKGLGGAGPYLSGEERFKQGSQVSLRPLWPRGGGKMGWGWRDGSCWAR